VIQLPHLETDLTQACQLSCVGCNHSVPLWRHLKGGPWATTPAQLEADLGWVAQVAHTPLWGALGGEPLLHHQIVDLLRIVRASGVADAIEVWTNGIALPKMRPDFWRSFDILVLSIYEGKHTPESLAWIRQKCIDEGVQLQSRDERRRPNFRALLEAVPTEEPVTTAKFRGCAFRQYSRVVNYGFFFTCCCAPHLPMLVQGQPFGTDGIPVEHLTEDRLRAYLERAEPLGACGICAGRASAVKLRWHEEKDPARWLSESKGRPS